MKSVFGLFSEICFLICLILSNVVIITMCDPSLSITKPNNLTCCVPRLESVISWPRVSMYDFGSQFDNRTCQDFS